MFFGGFGYTQNQNSPPSPTRASVWGSAYSPFRNTTMPLQDITANQTLLLPNGECCTNAKSPGKNLQSTAGGQGMAGSSTGRTMKEYEDQLSALKKENFNLKLRIYFLEERMGITSADEDAIKKNIELKVEIESLRKELMEKQELLSQAAKAFELIEEQKQTSSRNQAEYQQSLEKERDKIAQLERELENYREKVTDASMYYKEAFGITPEQALENQEKLHQMEELVGSLEAEVKQLTSSLEEERNWVQELESERDQFRERLEAETRLRENLTAERERDIDELRVRIKELEEQAFKKDATMQQYKNEIVEKDRIIKEKSSLLDEKCRAYDELSSVAEKRKRQIDQLRTSVKARDDAFAELNNKHRNLLSQYENGYLKRSPPSSPSTLNTFGDPLSPRIKSGGSVLDWEPNREKFTKAFSPIQTSSTEIKEIAELTKELEEKERELKRQEEAKKQLILKLCNVQKSSEVTEKSLKKVEADYEKAIKMIQGFMERQQQMEDKCIRKERRIMDLEIELNRLRGFEIAKGRSGHDEAARRDFSTELADNPERDHTNQQRFEEMESKINNLRDEIEVIKEEKKRLEKQIQDESQELQEQLQDKVQKIEALENEKCTIKQELRDKIVELDNIKKVYDETTAQLCSVVESADKEKLQKELEVRNAEIEEKNRKIEQLTKDLQLKTQNLQQLVNTELWSKNKEIAKLHNHMTASHCHDKSRDKSQFIQESAGTHLAALIKELNDIGIRVTFTNEVIQLNYVNGNEPIDIKTITSYIQKLVEQKANLEKEVDYLKWLRIVSKPDHLAAEIGDCGNENERIKKYCDLLRTHLKDLVKFMKEMLMNSDQADTVGNEHKKIVLDVLLSSKILSEDFVQALEDMSSNELPFITNVLEDELKVDGSVRKSRSENVIDASKNQASTQSDSEAFSEPDRTVSMARIGLQETAHQKSTGRSRFTKYTKTFSDSEDSIEYVPYHKTYQNDLNEVDNNHQVEVLKETNSLLYTELNALRNDLLTKISFDDGLNEKLAPVFSKLERYETFCERLHSSLEKRIHESQTLRKENKQNCLRKVQLEKKITDVENMAVEMAKRKLELMQYKENAERKTAEMLVILNRENDTLRAKIKKLEEENEISKGSISALTKELDQLTLSHSQILVENTKLTNDKLKLEQELRKTESRYDMAVRSLHEKFNKDILELSQLNETNRIRMQELEVTNKELRRHVTICEASDSAPSSSGVSSIPTEATFKLSCEDNVQEYQSYNNGRYWQPISYSMSSGRSKSSCSPDLGIESDAAVTTTRPLKDTLKITESMTNLLSDEDNGNHGIRDIDNESPLPIEGLDEMEVLRQENETLKRRLMKTKRALEDTFQHLSASNKNKKNVEKAITKQLMITKSILKKTRTYEEPFEN